LPDAYSFGRGGSGPTNITPPMPGTGNGGLAQGLLGGRFGYGGGGFGAGVIGRMRGAGRKPGLEPIPFPGTEELDPRQGLYDPERLFNVRNHAGSRATFSGGMVEQPTYDIQGRTTGKKMVEQPGGDFGFYGPNAGAQQLRGYSSALGSWRGRPGPSGGMSQGAGFGNQDDALRRLLEARMGGGF
jgi:hypothetical protein